LFAGLFVWRHRAASLPGFAEIGHLFLLSSEAVKLPHIQ
jgi:hypothetical protein